MARDLRFFAGYYSSLWPLFLLPILCGHLKHTQGVAEEDTSGLNLVFWANETDTARLVKPGLPCPLRLDGIGREIHQYLCGSEELPLPSWYINSSCCFDADTAAGGMALGLDCSWRAVAIVERCPPPRNLEDMSVELQFRLMLRGCRRRRQFVPSCDDQMSS